MEITLLKIRFVKDEKKIWGYADFAVSFPNSITLKFKGFRVVFNNNNKKWRISPTIAYRYQKDCVEKDALFSPITIFTPEDTDIFMKAAIKAMMKRFPDNVAKSGQWNLDKFISLNPIEKESIPAKIFYQDRKKKPFHGKGKNKRKWPQKGPKKQSPSVQSSEPPVKVEPRLI